MINKIKNIILIILLFLLVGGVTYLILSNRSYKAEITHLKDQIKNATKDTTIVSKIVDTIYSDTGQIRYIDKPIPVDTLYYNLETGIDSLNPSFHYSGTESFPTGNVLWNAYVRGSLDSINFKLNNKSIVVTRTEQVNNYIDTTSTNTTNNHFEMVAGARIGGNMNQFDFAPTLGIITNNNLQFQYSYGVISKTHNATVLKQFNFYGKRRGKNNESGRKLHNRVIKRMLR